MRRSWLQQFQCEVSDPARGKQIMRNAGSSSFRGETIRGKRFDANSDEKGFVGPELWLPQEGMDGRIASEPENREPDFGTSEAGPVDGSERVPINAKELMQVLTFGLVVPLLGVIIIVLLMK